MWSGLSNIRNFGTEGAGFGADLGRQTMKNPVKFADQQAAQRLLYLRARAIMDLIDWGLTDDVLTLSENLLGWLQETAEE